jgi:hypothetical protein
MQRTSVGASPRSAPMPRSRPFLIRLLRPRRREHLCVALACLATATCNEPAFAHGFAGKRFFPATLATEDPFVADELSLPTVSRRRTVSDDGSSSADSSASVDFTKRITPDFGLGFGASWLRLEPRGGVRQQGFDNLALNAKYQLFKSDARETILSVGVDADIGGSGARRVGAESFSTITPALFFGKGFGDLPDELRFLRPLALTGSAGVGIPTRASSSSVDDDGNAVLERHPHVLQLGFALEYSVPYLQAFVKDVGLPRWLQRAVPIVEFAFEKALDRGKGPTTGTINPGILFPGRTMQFGIEAVVPMNRRTGGGTGVLLQLHFFLDDLFPKSLGRPLVEP